MHKSAKLLLTLNEGVGFSLDAYLASLTAGFRFNTRKTDRYFQESTGPTLADDAGETVGLALEQRDWGGRTFSEVMASQPELLTDTEFLSGWTPSGGWAVAGGKATHTPGSAGQVVQAFSPTAGALYQVTYEVSGWSAGTTYPGFFGGSTSFGTVEGKNGVVTSYVLGISGNTSFGFFAQTTTYNGSIERVSLKRVPGNHARQTGASTLHPVRQAEGAKFDGTDDNWLMAYLAASGSNFIQAKTTVPASLAATQVVAGASGASANRVFLGVNTSGFACAGVGSDSTATIVGTTDLRGTEADIAVTFDGSTVRLIANGAVEYEAAQNSTPTTAIPFRIGALNNNGTAGSFYGGAVKDVAAGTDYLTLARFNHIRAAMAANQ